MRWHPGLNGCNAALIAAIVPAGRFLFELVEPVEQFSIEFQIHVLFWHVFYLFCPIAARRGGEGVAG